MAANLSATTNGTTQSQDLPKPTPHFISLSPTTTPGIQYFPTLSTQSALKASQLLNKNHTNHHVYFNTNGFHNHITHHLLSLFSANATTSQIQTAFDRNASYQRSQHPIRQDVVAELQKDRKNLIKYLAGESTKSTEKWYADLMEFWALEIKGKGVKEVLQEWVFKGDDVAEKVYGRLFAGFVHPLIHFGFGLEYHQPAILAEALAQTCVHDNWVYPYISACEKSSSSSSLTQASTKSRSLISILAEAKSNSKILNSVQWNDGNKLRDGALTRAFPEIVSLASQWSVHPTESEIEEKTAEMIVTTALIAGASAFHHEGNIETNPVKKDPRVDFFYMHVLNASIFFSSFIEDPEVSSLMTLEQKARLLQTKGWVDVGMYISRKCAVLDPMDIKMYRPRSSPNTNTNNKNNNDNKNTTDDNKGTSNEMKTGPPAWSEIYNRVSNYTSDDGHAVKLIRALHNGERVSKKYEDKEWCVIKGDMWVRLGYMFVDSIERCGENLEGGGDLYVRGTGWDRAWEGMPDWIDGGKGGSNSTTTSGGGGGGGKL